MTISTFRAIASAVLVAGVLTGCAAPQIDKAGYTKPKKVAIADFPDMKPAAIIGLYFHVLPQTYFGPESDGLFVAAGGEFGTGMMMSSMGTGVAVGAVTGAQQARNSGMSTTAGAVGGGLLGAAIGAAIDVGAQATQKKAEAFPELMAQTMPGVNTREEVLKALTASLKQKGIAVTMLSDSRNMAPRLRWPANDNRGKPFEPGPLADSAPVDADILVQIVPVTLYASPGPLNNYNSLVGIGVAMYEGRTRKFIGWQAFTSKQNPLWYARYDSLVADIQRAGPAQLTSLLSLVPAVSDVISGDQPTAQK